MSDYEYNYTYVAPLAFVQTVPREARPTLAWYGKMVVIALKIAKNRLSAPVSGGLAGMGAQDMSLPLDHLEMEALDLGSADLENLDLDKPAAAPESGLAGMGFGADLALAARVTAIAAAIAAKGILDPFGILDTVIKDAKGGTGRPTSMDSYRELFRTIPLPPVATDFTTDATFAAMRVAGWNPLVIQRVAHASFPATDAHLAAAGQAGDTLAAAGADGRLYEADYVALKDVFAGNYPDGPKYSFAPKALFVRPKNGRKLAPVAIQCGQDAASYAVFGPADGEAWTRAKIIVSCADANHHELVSHLGQTHLVNECFAIATPRRLAPTHPIGRLLRPHLEGTLAINDAAQSTLIGPKGQVDQALSGTIATSRIVAATAVVGFQFEQAWLPNRLAARGVLDPDLEYPYRDDAVQLWAAIRSWVQANVEAAYADDAAIAADADLLAWGRELAAQDGARLFSFGEGGQAGAIRTRGWLTDALTMVIFTASAQHAAVNFPQGAIMTYTPAAPTAVYRAAPTNVADALLSDPLDMYPPMDMAQLQLEFLTLLGTAYYTQLGQYEPGLFPPALAPALATFQAALKTIEANVDVANRSRYAYAFLKPSLIPQSINV